ncbi:hypothetical protein [Staphylococcus saprophyticus]|uniref:hypothetical protein n=1 Tax=Staphylococcus saprophyticus TaxID=29385 RepID=UPI001F4F5C3E|nr:hypothetical protein [Staphylococcus saprophyticus]MEB7998456.1 hypothetical protein [Staphylococcus saprophyticus]
MKNNINAPIVDTDIWVFLIMSGFYKRLIEYYGFLQFSDVVEKEIMRWSSNKEELKEIALTFKKLKDEHKIKVILFDDFENLEQKSINHQLNEYGLREVRIIEKNKGEFTSLLYALHKGIGKFKTNDRKFVTEISEDNYDDITIINWDEMLSKYCVSFKEKIEVQKLIANKETKMKKQRETYQKEQRDPRWDKLEKLVGG